MAYDFSVSGQHYLFNVQTFAHTVLALGGDSYNYAFRDRTTQGVIDDVASGSELGVVFETSATAADLDAAFDAAGLEFVQLAESAPRGAAGQPPAGQRVQQRSSSLPITPTSTLTRAKTLGSLLRGGAGRPAARQVHRHHRPRLALRANRGPERLHGHLRYPRGHLRRCAAARSSADADVTLRLGYLKKKGAQPDGTAARFVATLEKNLERYAKF